MHQCSTPKYHLYTVTGGQECISAALLNITYTLYWSRRVHQCSTPKNNLESSVQQTWNLDTFILFTMRQNDRATAANVIQQQQMLFNSSKCYSTAANVIQQQQMLFNSSKCYSITAPFRKGKTM